VTTTAAPTVSTPPRTNSVNAEYDVLRLVADPLQRPLYDDLTARVGAVAADGDLPPASSDLAGRQPVPAPSHQSRPRSASV
jgi:hypothetical protein